jgi:hypothetical protein
VEFVSFSAMSYVGYILIMLGQLYFYCYYGTKLFEEVCIILHDKQADEEIQIFFKNVLLIMENATPRNSIF